MKHTTQKVHMLYHNGAVNKYQVGVDNVKEIEYSWEELLVIITFLAGKNIKKLKFFGVPFITEDEE